MMMTSTARSGVGALAGRRILAIAVILAGAGLAACESDPIDPDEHDEGDVAGFRIDALLETPGGGSRETLLTYDGPTAPDTLYLTAGRVTDIEIVWLDEHGDALELPADEHSWQLDESHTALGFEPSASEPWRGTLTTATLAPGLTVYGGYTVTLFHGDEAEFQTVELVAAASAAMGEASPDRAATTEGR